jgi:hypothetical protein
MESALLCELGQKRLIVDYDGEPTEAQKGEFGKLNRKTGADGKVGTKWQIYVKEGRHPVRPPS